MDDSCSAEGDSPSCSSKSPDVGFPGVPLVPLFLALSLAAHGLRKGSLAPSGAITAAIVGFAIMAVPLRTFGVSLIVFYLVGSRATKLGKERKAKIEQGHAEAGYRDGWQVLSNSFTALIAASAWGVLFTPRSLHSHLYQASVAPAQFLPTWSNDGWCAALPPSASGWSRTLLFVSLGHFACCLGDTLASEIGVLSKSPPLLITTLKRVPPGTNGALSLLGTLASVAGGAIMGLTFAATLFTENAECRTAALLLELVWYGSLAGLVGSMIDSLLGATIQRTRYAVDSKLILPDDAPDDIGEKVKVVSGLNILTNNQINLLSSILTAALLGQLA